MRTCAILISFVLLVPVVMAAQMGRPSTAFEGDGPRVTVFGGFPYLRNNSNGFGGWQGEGTFNFTRYLGVTGDVSGDYRSPGSFSISGVTASANQHLYTFMAGPSVTANVGRNAFFAHALFGEAHSSLGAGVSIPIIGGISSGLTSANAFAMAFGGGVDIGVSRHLAIRAIQVDYLRTQFSAADALATGFSTSLNNYQNSFRYSAGIVFRF
jgi:opacity protein-like surface antigen